VPDLPLLYVNASDGQWAFYDSFDGIIVSESWVNSPMWKTHKPTATDRILFVFSTEVPRAFNRFRGKALAQWRSLFKTSTGSC
jgi:hypothetical protein